MKKRQSIDSLFLDICYDAYQDGLIKHGICNSVLRSPLDKNMRPGYFYSNLPQEIKDRLSTELKPSHTQSIIQKLVHYGGHVIPSWERNTWEKDYKNLKLAFEMEILKNGHKL